MKFLHRSTYVALGLAAALSAAASAASAASQTPSLVSPAADLRTLRDLGKLGAASNIRLTVGLRLHDESGLDALLAAQSIPGSPFYRHYLEPAQVRDAFGASQADYGKTVATLRRAGFAIARLDPMRTIIDATAPAATVEKYFSTKLHAVAIGPHATSYANVTPALVPAELQGSVSAVTGFKAVPLFTTAAAAARNARSASGGIGAALVPRPAATTAPTPPPGPAPIYGPDGGYGPQLTASAFDLPIRHGFRGSGAAVADVVDGVVDDTADIAPYLSEFGVKRTGPPTTIVPVDGGCLTGIFGCFDSFSAAIDAQQILGVAPGVAYFVYEVPSPFTTKSFVDGVNAIVRDNRADVANIAFAGCETAIGEGAFLLDQGFKLGSAQGISFVVTTFGGSNPCFTNKPSVQAPGDSPHALTVGGADTFADQFGQVTSPPITNTGTGGGVSLLFPKPSFQNGVAGTRGGGRNLPDLAGPAAINSFGASEYYAPFGGWIGGFPFVNVAPFTGGVAGVAQVYGSRLGVVGDLVYPLFKANGYAGNVFRDVTLGCNGIGAGPPYCAAPGYDLVTGIGVPSLYKVAKKI